MPRQLPRCEPAKMTTAMTHKSVALEAVMEVVETAEATAEETAQRQSQARRDRSLDLQNIRDRNRTRLESTGHGRCEEEVFDAVFFLVLFSALRHKGW